MKIFIVCSKKFYEKVLRVRDILVEQKHEVILPNCFEDPEKELRLKEENQEGHATFVQEQLKISEDKVAECDAILVYNGTWKDDSHYIGGATFLEMFMAYSAGKQIYIYQSLTEDKFTDEVMGFNPVILEKDFACFMNNSTK